MAKNTEIFFTKEGKTAEVQISSIGKLFLLTAPVNGCKILGLAVDVGFAGNIALFSGPDAVNSKHLARVEAPTSTEQLMDRTSLPKDKNGNRYANVEGGQNIYVEGSSASGSIVFVYYEEY